MSAPSTPKMTCEQIAGYCAEIDANVPLAVDASGGWKRGFLADVLPAQDSTDASAVIEGSMLDCGPYSTLSLTLSVASNAVKWTVYGANMSNHNDDVVVQNEAVVNAAAIGTFTGNPLLYRYYRVKIVSNVAGQAGSCVLAYCAR